MAGTRLSMQGQSSNKITIDHPTATKESRPTQEANIFLNIFLKKIQLSPARTTPSLIFFNYYLDWFWIMHKDY